MPAFLWRRPASLAQALTPYSALLVAAVAGMDAASEHRYPALLALAVGFTILSWRGPRKRLALVASLLAGLAATAQIHLALDDRGWARSADSRMLARLDEIEKRKTTLGAHTRAYAERAAALPDAVAALSGDRAALVRLFRSLEEIRARAPEAPALAIHGLPLSLAAWSGGAPDSAALEGIVEERSLFILEGSVTTTLVAAVRILDLKGTPRGIATASITLATRRNLRNDVLQDYDLLVGADKGTEIRYVDARASPAQLEPFPPLDPALLARERLLRAPDRLPLASLRVTSRAGTQSRQELLTTYRILISLLGCALVVAWLPGEPRLSLRLLVLATLRVALLQLGAPLPPDSPLLAPESYSNPVLGPLLRSPADLFLTAACALALVWLLVPPALRRLGTRVSSQPLALLASLASLGLSSLAFLALRDAVQRSALDIETILPIPASPTHLAIQLSLLLLAASAGLLSVPLQVAAGPWPRAPLGRLVRLGVWAAAFALAWRSWPREFLTLALVFILAGAAALLAAGQRRLGPRLTAAKGELRAGFLIAATAFLALLLCPALFQAAEADLRRQVETNYAPTTLRQSEWRDQVLASSLRRLDTMELLEETPPSGRSQSLEELAFAVWSLTDLAAYGFSSAIEVLDSKGVVISRFALNLPSLEPPARSLPSDNRWKISAETASLASAQRTILHARRRLTYHGEFHGALHVLVGDDYWNLPFLRSRDPYSVLFRPGNRGPQRARGVVLLVYDPKSREAVFSSAARAPALQPEAVRSRLAARASSGPGTSGASGFWGTLSIDGAPHRTFFFANERAIHALGYAQATPGRYAADLVEAVASLTLLVVGLLLGLLLLRTLFGRSSFSLVSLVRTVQRRFTARLFVAMVALGVGPVVVLQIAVRGLVAGRLQREFENQALERAAFARKLIEDYAFFQRRELAASVPIGDEPLVWVASLIRNDLSLFEHGRLAASSKPELFASGLLAPRVSGAAYRALALEGQPSILEGEGIGDLSYLVVSVPVRLGTAEKGILTIPLALRQREVSAAVEELGRTIRLASVAFLALAALIAQSMARKISGPIRELTAASHRIAKGDLEARVDPTTRDEIQGLVEAFNQMAGDLERQRRDLERSNRLAAWAEMARQVAHEVKNPLTPIQLSAEHLRRIYRDPGIDFGAALESCTETILKQVRTLRGIVHEFSAFARPPAATREPLDPAALVNEALSPYRGALPPGVDFQVEVAPGLPLLYADRRLLERAIVNLIENGLHALGEGGTLGVRVRADADRVLIEVQDSGGGVDPDIRDRVFEPFFSTKATGSGLGLALVKKIAEDHGGGIDLESEPGRGTRATLWLPAQAREHPPGPSDPGSG